MLPSDRHHKRKNMHRQRSRITPFISEAIPRIPRTTPVEQVPFPDNAHLFAYGAAHTPLAFPPGVSEAYPMASTNVLTWQARITPDISSPMHQPISGSAPANIAYPLLSPSPRSRHAGITSDVGEQETEQIVLSALSAGPVRPVVIIPGNGSKLPLAVSEPLPQGRRVVVRGALSMLLFFITISAIMTVLSVDSKHASDLFPSSFHNVAMRKNDTALIGGPVATATAVTMDGYDPGGGHVYAGVQAAPADIHVSASDYGSLSRFFYGQCTYWTNMRYHQETGHWIPWLGNAYQWAYQAPAYGWTIAATPNPHGSSIIVFSPFAQGAGSYGHVAVVEKVNADGSVLTSNWNWNGDWATLSWRTFYPGPGISFVWYPA